MQTRRLRIRGRVQGVWFRESMRREAQRLGVAGWVRNLPDGSVEAIVQGENLSVEMLIAWSNSGPPLARVEHVEIEEASGHFAGFEKRSTPET
ncbi:MAG: acylphosphatase [Pseudomonadota bacterium]